MFNDEPPTAQVRADNRHVHIDHPNYPVTHANHEQLHTILFLFLIFFLILAQFGLHYWKHKHYRSFRNITLVGMWMIPFVFSLLLQFWRMLFVWSTFTLTTCFILYQAQRNPLSTETPKRVYLWFFWVYRACASSAFAGYVFIMIEFVGIGRLLSLAFNYAIPFPYLGWLMISYGLYYGVLGRDCAEMCTDMIANRMGFTGKGLPSKKLVPGMCCICGESYQNEKGIEINCKHVFHDRCIRGWTMIGKKDTCPYCSEKVELKALFSNPWEKQGILWGNLMDALRYLIVWNPIILIAIQLFLYLIDPEL